MKYSNNPAYQEEIRKSKTPAAAKKLGKSAEKSMREDWNTYRETVMMNVNREKFGDAHPELKQLLISTGDAILLNASPQDNFWGIGRKREGRNKLGKILMEIRGDLAPKAPPMEANEHIIATNIPPPPEPMAPFTAAAAAAPPVVNIQVVNTQPEQNALNVAATMLENQSFSTANMPAAPVSSNGPVLVIEEGEGLPLDVPNEQVAALPAAALPATTLPTVPGPDTSNIKVITVNAAAPPKN